MSNDRTRDGEQLDRRGFLKRSAGITASLSAGFAVQDGGGTSGDQGDDDGDQYRYRRRMAFRRADELSGDYRNRIILVTDPTKETEVQVPDRLADCQFDSETWRPDNVAQYQGLVIEWESSGSITVVGDQPVNPEAAVNRELFVQGTNPPIEPGTPFIIGTTIDCPGDYVGVLANRIPAVRFENFPDTES